MSGKTKVGVRVRTPFAGALHKMGDAAKAYFSNPVLVTLPVELVDPSDPTFEIIRDEIVAAIVDVDHKSNDGSIVLVRAKVISGSKEIKSVPVPSNGNSDASVEVLCKGDDLTLIVDTVYGDASIIRISDSVNKLVDLNDLSSILCRLVLPAGLPDSKGDPITWEDFISGEEPGGGDGDGDDDNN